MCVLCWGGDWGLLTSLTSKPTLSPSLSLSLVVVVDGVCVCVWLTTAYSSLTTTSSRSLVLGIVLWCEKRNSLQQQVVVMVVVVVL
jgi:hypothetical protein